MHLFTFLLSILITIKLSKFVFGSRFKKIKKNEIELSDWANDNPNRKELTRNLSDSGFSITETYQSLSNRFSYLNFTDDYWIVGTGYNSIDDGPWFFFIPTYTRVLIIDRISERVVEKKLFFKDLTNAKIVGSELFFRYDDPMLITLITNLHRINELDSEIRKLGKCSLKNINT